MKRSINAGMMGLLLSTTLLFSGCGSQTSTSSSTADADSTASETTESVNSTESLDSEEEENVDSGFTYKNISTNSDWSIIEIPVETSTIEDMADSESVSASINYTEDGEELPKVMGKVAEESSAQNVVYSNVIVSYGGNSIEEDLYFYEDCRAWFLKSGESKYVWLDHASDDNMTMLSVFDFSQDTPVFVNADINTEGDIEADFTDPDAFEMSKWTNVVSPVISTSEYRIDESGMPEAVTGWYRIENSDSKLTAKADIACTVLDQTDDENELNWSGSDGTIPSGTELTILGSDDNVITDLQAEDGTIYRVAIDDANAYPHTIGGTEVRELFDGIAVH